MGLYQLGKLEGELPQIIPYQEPFTWAGAKPRPRLSSKTSHMETLSQKWKWAQPKGTSKEPWIDP